tara:strand:- start:46 stop:588 length:543 start_codon:yes stop_codon:yes gene_type:complete
MVLRVILIAPTLFLVSSMSGQQISRDVLATAGSTDHVGDLVIVSTVGQVLTGASFVSTGVINQGFQQPFPLTEEVTGCLDVDACNYNPLATGTDSSCDFISCLIGCTDADACNFDPDVIADDGSCDFSCCPGPGCCNDGTHWDEDSQTCIVSEPADINFDGCVQLNDLLDLLSSYGNCSN